MICNKFEKIEKDGGCYYIPLYEEYIFSNKYKKEKILDIEIPKEAKCKKAVPLLLTTSNSFNKLSEDIKLEAIYLFYGYLYLFGSAYPFSFKMEIVKGVFVSFRLAEFFTAEYLDLPVVKYTAGGEN